MKFILLLLIFTSSVSSFASYQVNTVLEVDGQKISPKFFLNEGEWVEYRTGDLALKLNAIREEKDIVRIEAQVTKITGDKRELLGSPHFLTPVNQGAEVAEAKDLSSSGFRLKVTPAYQ